MLPASSRRRIGPMQSSITQPSSSWVPRTPLRRMRALAFWQHEVPRRMILKPEAGVDVPWQLFRCRSCPDVNAQCHAQCQVSPFVWLLFTSLVAELLTGSFGILQMVKHAAESAVAAKRTLCIPRVRKSQGLISITPWRHSDEHSAGSLKMLLKCLLSALHGVFLSGRRPNFPLRRSATKSVNVSELCGVLLCFLETLGV